MADREVVVLSGVRTAIGDYGGSLKGLGATDLGAMVIEEAIKRSGVEAGKIGHGVIGNVIHGEGFMRINRQIMFKNQV